MSSGKPFYVPEDVLQELLVKFRSGVTLTKLQAEYGIPYHVLQNRLFKYNLNIQNPLLQNASLIRKAEDKLISGKFPNYKFEFEINTVNDLKKYKSLVMAYAWADLNGDRNQINELLLK